MKSEGRRSTSRCVDSSIASDSALLWFRPSRVGSSLQYPFQVVKKKLSYHEAVEEMFEGREKPMHFMNV